MNFVEAGRRDKGRKGKEGARDGELDWNRFQTAPLALPPSENFTETWTHTTLVGSEIFQSLTMEAKSRITPTMIHSRFEMLVDLLPPACLEARMDDDLSVDSCLRSESRASAS